MQKTFCDICGRELKEEHIINHRKSLNVRLKPDDFLFNTTMTIEIDTHSLDNKLPNPDICKYCIIDCLNEIDDRPKCKVEMK